MKIGILQCGHAPDLPRRNHGDFDAMFIRILAPHGVSFTTYDVVDGIFPTSPDAADAWLLTGSKHGAYEDHAFIKPLEPLIRAIHASSKRMIGICFGHQIVAQALGGSVEKFAGGWAIGRTRYDFDVLGDIYLNAWHQDQVTQLPQGAQVIARNDFCVNAGLLYRDSILTLQAHPEISPAVIADYLTMAETDTTYSPQVIAHARATNANTTDDARIARVLINFLETGQIA